VELALSGAASFIVTWTVRDVAGGDLPFPDVRVRTPGAFLEEAT